MNIMQYTLIAVVKGSKYITKKKKENKQKNYLSQVAGPIMNVTVIEFNVIKLD